MNYIDILISLTQSILFFYMIKYCMGEAKIPIIKLIMYIIVFSIISVTVPEISKSILLGSLLTHVCTLILTVCIFIKFNRKNVLIAYSLIYSIGVILVFIFGNLLYGLVESIISINYIKINTIILMYGSQIVLYLVCYAFRTKIKELYKILIYENISVDFIIIISFLPDFLLSSYFISYNIDNSIFKRIVTIAFCIFLGFSIFCFLRIIKKANEINKLNRTLAIKNIELKKIKNDYGLQMSCLYELVDMERYDDTVRFLKSIINQNDPNMNNENSKKSSLLSLATRHANKEGINVIVQDNADFKLSTIEEMELYRIIINIVNNAIRAMKNSGTLIAKSFQDFKNIVITIENNGEKIPEEIIDKIFDSGFTTKSDNDKNHGYGLCIAKELIEKHCGRIFVESSDNITRFTINLPIKQRI